jgi:glycosyltransferase involved in cell wall biosynthesis
MQNKKLTIAFIYEFDANDPTRRSGVPYQILTNLEQLGHRLVLISPLDETKRCLTSKMHSRIMGLYFNKLLKGKRGTYLVQRSKSYLKALTKQAEAKLKYKEYDLVFTPDPYLLSYLGTDKPKFFWTDATFKNIYGYYDGFTNFIASSEKEYFQADKLAFTKATNCIFTSEWAAKNANKSYGINYKNISIIPRGANISSNYNYDKVYQRVKTKDHRGKKVFLIIQADWERKGGVFTVEIIKELNKTFDCYLKIVGKKPKNIDQLPDWCEYIGWLNKKEPNDFLLFEELMLTSHFFIMPSKAENFGIVYCEASAYGLPSIARNTGGVSSAVSDRNGILINSDQPEDFARAISPYLLSESKCKELSLSSLQEYKNRLNWKTNTQKLCEVFYSEINK